VGRGEEEDALTAGLKVKVAKDLPRVFEEMARRRPALIRNTEGHYLLVEKLKEGDVKDTPGQRFRFVVDWDLERRDGKPPGSWDPRRVVERLDGEQRRLYEEEFKLYEAKGWWKPAQEGLATADGEATVFPVLSEGKTTKVRPVIDLRTVNSRSSKASNSRCRVNGAVTKMRGVLQTGGSVMQNDLSKAFYRISTRKRWLIKTGSRQMESERLLFGLNFGPAALEAVLRAVRSLVSKEMERLKVEMVELMDDYLLIGKRGSVEELCKLLDAALDFCGFNVPADKREWWNGVKEVKWLGAYWKWDGSVLTCRREEPDLCQVDWGRLTKRVAFQVAGQFPDITRTPGECQARVHMDLVRRLAGAEPKWDKVLDPKTIEKIKAHVAAGQRGWTGANVRGS